MSPRPSTWSWGARRFGYSETHYYGNPGLYLTYTIGYAQGGAGLPEAELSKAYDELCRHPYDSQAGPGDELRRFRRSVRLNSYGEISPHRAEADSFPWATDIDYVRVVRGSNQVSLHDRFDAWRTERRLTKDTKASDGSTAHE